MERAREPVPGPRRRLLSYRSQRHRATGQRADRQGRQEEAGEAGRRARRPRALPLRARQDRPALHLPGDGRRRQGRCHPRRLQRRRSGRRRGPLLQAALAGRARPRLPVAHHAAPAAARSHRRLQPQLLRRGAGGARAPRDPGVAEAALASGGRQAVGRAPGRRSASTSAIWPRTAPWCSSSSSTSRATSSAGASWPDSTSPARTGSSPRATCARASAGTTT